jgi:hypothetical protein
MRRRQHAAPGARPAVEREAAAPVAARTCVFPYGKPLWEPPGAAGSARHMQRRVSWRSAPPLGRQWLQPGRQPHRFGGAPSLLLPVGLATLDRVSWGDTTPKCPFQPPPIPPIPAWQTLKLFIDHRPNSPYPPPSAYPGRAVGPAQKRGNCQFAPSSLVPEALAIQGVGSSSKGSLDAAPTGPPRPPHRGHGPPKRHRRELEVPKAGTRRGASSARSSLAPDVMGIGVWLVRRLEPHTS